MYQLANHDGRQRSMNGMNISSPEYSGTTSYEEVRLAVQRMICWLDNFGESSQDLYDFYATQYGQVAKRIYYRRPSVGTLCVAPLVFMEAFLPAARRLFWPR